MSSPEIGSKWRSKRTGRVSVVAKLKLSAVGVSFVKFGRRSNSRWVFVFGDGHPCGYEPVEEVERE